MYRLYFFFFLFPLFNSCTFINNNKNIDEIILARVEDKILYKSDIHYNALMGDSVDYYNNQIQLWIKRQLILNNAFQNIEAKREIEKKSRKI